MAETTSNLSVCFFSHSSRIEGAERSLLQLITELIRDHRVRVTVFLPGGGPLAEKLEQVGAATVRVDYSWWCDTRPLRAEEMTAELSNSFELLLGTINRKLARIKPDVILTNTTVIPWGAIMASLLGKPHVWYVRENGYLQDDLQFFLPFPEIIKIITDSSNLIINNSHSVSRALFGETSERKIVTVYTSVEIPIDALGGEPEGNYFRRPKATKLIITGTIAERKGQADAIQAVKELINRNREVELIIMGTVTPYLKALQTMVSEQNLEDYVTFLEFRENPYPVVNRADVVLVCSTIEAFGRVTVEAMLLKKPVIGTNVGGTMELIKPGYNGLLYESGDYRQLADKIEYLIDHKQKMRKLGETGFEFARRNFTSGYGSRIYELLKELKGRPNPLSSSFLDFLKQSIFALHGTVAQKEEEIAQLEHVIRERDQALAWLRAQTNESEDLIRSRDDAIAWLNGKADEKDKVIGGRDEALAWLRAQVDEGEDMLRSRDEAIAWLTAQVKESADILRERDEAIAWLTAQVKESADILRARDEDIAWLKTQAADRTE